MTGARARERRRTGRRSLLATTAVGMGLLGVLAGTILLARRDTWSCRSVNIAAGSMTGPTARGALDRYIGSGAVPGDLWGASEPNRFTRSKDGTQLVVNVYQMDESTWAVTRADVCGR